MASLSTRQSSPTSSRATVAHLGRAQQPRPLSLSSRALVGHLGVGRRYTDTTSLLTPRRLALPVPPLPDFSQLHAEAQQLQRQMAIRDSTYMAPRPAQTPREAGYPLPFLSPTEQAQRQQQAQRERAQLVERLLADYNRLKTQTYISEALRKPMMNGLHNLLTQLGTSPASPSGPDSFMPNTFWQSQNPDGKQGWAKKVLGN